MATKAKKGKEVTLDTANKKILQAKFYNLIAMVFAVLGIVLFIFLYMAKARGDFLSFIKEPSSIVMIVLPFLPAIVLSLIATGMEKKYRKYLLVQQEEKKPEDDGLDMPMSRKK